MEFSEDFIKANGLNDDQISAIKSVWSDTLANEKQSIEKEFEGMANKNAEGILNGALKSLEKEYSFNYERPQGEKIADSVGKAMGMVFGSEKEGLSKLKSDYEQKIKSGGGNVDEIKAQYELEKDELLKKYADYDILREKASKADEYGEKLSGLKLQVAYSNVQPEFPDTVNKFEAKYKWDEFVKSVNDKYTIELNENNEAIYIDKENRHKTGMLADLVKADESLNELSKGREQGGTGARQRELEQIEGVPFDVPKDADNKQIDKAVKDYLAKSNVSITSKEYQDKYTDLIIKIKRKTAA